MVPDTPSRAIFEFPAQADRAINQGEDQTSEPDVHRRGIFETAVINY
jgi:hypothetical protein